MKTSDNTAIKQIFPLVEAMRWGRPESIAEAGNNLAAALDVSHPAVAKKLRSLTTNGRTATVNLAAKVEGLVHFETAAHGIGTVILLARVEVECQAIIEEHCRREELAPALTPGHDVSHLAERVSSLGLRNLYEVVQLCQRVRRDLVLQQGMGIEVLLSGAEVVDVTEIIDHNGVSLVANPFQFRRGSST